MNTSRSNVSSDEILQRIRGEYVEMPGLRVTHQQAQRLWGLEAETCLAALEHLIGIGFLRKTQGDQYARLTDGPAALPPLRMMKAGDRREVPGRIAV